MLRIMCMSVPHVLKTSFPALLLLTYSPHRRSTSAPVWLATGRSPPPLFTQKPPQHRSADTEQRSAATAAWKAECFLSGCFMIILDNQILTPSHHEKNKDLLRGSNAVRQHRWRHTCDELRYTAEPSPASITLSLRPPGQRPVRLCATAPPKPPPLCSVGGLNVGSQSNLNLEKMIR